MKLVLKKFKKSEVNMKYLMMMLFAVFFVMNSVIAEQNKNTDNDKPSKSERRNKGNKKKSANHWRILQNISQEERIQIFL